MGGDNDPRSGRLGEHGWTSVKVLGKGQFGIAYLVRPGVGQNTSLNIRKDTTGGQHAVAKMVSLDFLSEKDNLQAGQEVMLLKQLNHPNIVAYYDHYLSEEPVRELVILMEYCEGGELRQKIKDASKEKAQFKEAQIMRWFCQALSALSYVHKMHILHRDLKSSNIFLRGQHDRDCAIGDFGISRVLEGTIDAAATVVGTPYYMSPEVCRSEPYSYKSDIWSLGCVLYEMCMLKHAFESENLLGLVYKIVSDRYDPIPGQYTQDLSSLIARMLDKSAHSRPKGEDVLQLAYVKKHMAHIVAEQGGDSAGGKYRRNQINSDLFTSADSGGGPSSREQPGRRSDQYQKRVAPSLGPGAQKKRKPTPLSFDAKDGPPVAGSARTEQGSARPAAQEETPSKVPHSSPDTSPVHDTADAETKMIIHLMMSRVRHQVVQQKLNWMHVFSMFDRRSEGLLNEADFSRAMTAMHLGLSHGEIKDLFLALMMQQAATNSGNEVVQVSAFARALNSIPLQVTQIEEWAASQLLQVAKTVNTSPNLVVKGAKVRIQNLRNSPQLNGLEGIATNWDPTACRWIIRIETTQELKAIKDANLTVVDHAANPVAEGLNASSPSAALYQKICGSDPSGVVAEKAFLDCISDVVTTDRERRRMLALAPKNVEGYVDVRALLAEDRFVRLSGGKSFLDRDRGPPPEGFEGSPRPPVGATRAGATPSTTAGTSSMPSNTAAMPGALGPGPGFHPSSPSRPADPSSRKSSSLGTPASVTAPPPMNVPPGMPPPTPGSYQRTQSAERQPGERSEASVIILWRLAQRLNNTRTSLRVILSLFHSGGRGSGDPNANKLQLEDFLEAVSTCPLGVSRVEAHRVFQSLSPGGSSSSSSGGDLKPISLDRFEKAIASTAERYGTSPPSCPDDFDRIHFNALATECQKLDPESSGFLPPQTFRMILMQTEPYLTGLELDWIVSATDKDGDGNLEYATFLWRKTPGQPYRPRWTAPSSIVQQCKAVTRVAPSLPVDYVQKVLLARLHRTIEEKLVPGMNKSCIAFLLDVLSLFADGDRYLQEQRFSFTLGLLLGYLPFGLSKDEAAFIVEHAKGAGISSSLAASSAGSVLLELTTWAKSKLGPNMGSLRKALTEQYMFTQDEWFMHEELSNCFTLTDNSFNDLDLDRFLMLVEKNFAGKLNAVDFWQKVNPGERSFLSAKTQQTMKKSETKSWVQMKKEEAGEVGEKSNRKGFPCCPCLRSAGGGEGGSGAGATAGGSDGNRS
ncbi:unnamed protein product [Amoebophrya sp. A120]|nr:unnamed protein product [Amoebophrya sp. A120]|eukprot:GSA120T00016597001.1